MNDDILPHKEPTTSSMNSAEQVPTTSENSLPEQESTESKTRFHRSAAQRLVEAKDQQHKIEEEIRSKTSRGKLLFGAEILKQAASEPKIAAYLRKIMDKAKERDKEAMELAWIAAKIP